MWGLDKCEPGARFCPHPGDFHPPYRPQPGIDSTARIAPGVEIGEGASVGAYVVIGAGVRIGSRAVIHPQVTIYPGVRIGDDFICHSHVSIRENVVIGDRVVLHNGAVIGSEGFGFVQVGEGLAKIPQTGNVVIEGEVEIGANTTIDRATVGSTLDSARGQARQPGAYRAQLRSRNSFAFCGSERNCGFDANRRMVRIWWTERGRGSCPDWRPGQGSGAKRYRQRCRGWTYSWRVARRCKSGYGAASSQRSCICRSCCGACGRWRRRLASSGARRLRNRLRRSLDRSFRCGCGADP